MFNRNRPDNESHRLDAPIEALIVNLDINDEDYAKSVELLKTLMEIRQADKASTRRTVSPDVIATCVAQLLGIIMILGYEKTNVLTSKALTFVTRPRT